MEKVSLMVSAGQLITRVVFELRKSNKITINMAEEFAKETSKAMLSIQ